MITKSDIQEFYSYVTTYGLFRGVFAADQIPDLGPGPAWIIVNTAISSTRGEHWLVIGVYNSLMIFFDSFGRPPTTFNTYISDFASRYSWYYYDVCFQDSETEVCGYYTIFVIVRIAEGYSHWDIKRELEECGNSDNYVEQQVKATYRKAVERSKLPSLFGSGICVLLYVLILSIAFYLIFNSTQMIRSKCNPRTYSDYAMYDDHMMDID
ncbi:hypothetical protein AVEN_149017-1 [Araneus ventricosus]|uniref:Ubiquitin-like protease family profile domain-containing protein n=1 Tax=Araneus ventricosus TaxID=182803 RepID=A0A4Y2R5Z1_ARAVE|nr:hypothetical protein AVEN_149017-1 [Araneus ventricosus]